MELWKWAWGVSFKELTDVPHKTTEPALGLFSTREKAFNSQERYSNSTGEIIFCPFSYHPSSPPPFAPNVDESIASWGGHEARTDHSPLPKSRVLSIGWAWAGEREEALN